MVTTVSQPITSLEPFVIMYIGNSVLRANVTLPKILTLPLLEHVQVLYWKIMKLHIVLATNVSLYMYLVAGPTVPILDCGSVKVV